MKKTLLTLQENLFDLLLRMGGLESRWMFSVPALEILGLLTGSPVRLSRRTPGRPLFHPKQTLYGVTFQRAHPLPATPLQRTRSRTATLGWGAAALTLAWLYIAPSPCGGVRPAGEPVDSDPGPSSRRITTSDQALVASLSLECVTTPGSRRSCRG